MHVEQARLEFCRGSWDAAVGLAELYLDANLPVGWPRSHGARPDTGPARRARGGPPARAGPSTVESHVAAVFGKPGAASRRAASARAAELGVLDTQGR